VETTPTITTTNHCSTLHLCVATLLTQVAVAHLTMAMGLQAMEAWVMELQAMGLQAMEAWAMRVMAMDLQAMEVMATGLQAVEPRRTSREESTA
jgi:hypothetical protein